MTAHEPAAEQVAQLEQELARLQRINEALMTRVERSLTSGASAFGVFERALALEELVGQRTRDLMAAKNVAEAQAYELKQQAAELEQARAAAEAAEHRLRVKLQCVASNESVVGNVTLPALIDVQDLQRIQDAFARASGVASIISDVNGVPITSPSSFCGVCQIVRSTPKGRQHCEASDRVLGERARQSMRPTYEKCRSCGFVDASAPIIVGGKHVANWLIGQSNVMGVDRPRIRAYAREIGADEAAMLAAYDQLSNMSLEQFERTLELLWVLAQKLSMLGYNNLLLTRDVVELRKAKDALRAGEERLRSILDTVHAGVFLVEEESHTITEVNAAALRLFGAPREQVVGLSCRKFMCAAPGGRCPITEPDQVVEGMETVVRTVSGEQVPVLKSVSRCELNGRPHLIESFVDIRLRKQAEAQLERARDLAESANRSKSEFLANMSHEIRTPLTAILGFAEVMLEQAGGEEAAPALAIIKRNGEHLLAVINDILDLSKIEAGKMSIELRACAPADVVAEVLSLMRVRAEAKGVALRAAFATPIPRTVQTDPTRLRQILLNLVGNAIKFTEVGRVDLLVRYLAEADTARLEFDIVDTGIGLSAEQTRLLFEPFSQVDATARRQHGGTGLGLAISRRLAQRLGGDVTLVSSRLGSGSCFRLTLAVDPRAGVELVSGVREAGRRRAEPPDGLAADGGHPLGHRRVLLAEDGPDNQRLISHFLRQAGATVTVTENGMCAVRAARDAVEQGQPFDVVLMDMQMPVMDGYEATGMLRRLGYRGAIIALTAHAMLDDRQRCLDAGCDDYAAKPINRAALIHVICKYLPAAPALSASEAAGDGR
ncbi:MAG: PocR ligand-binding domain-containing protein [Phycisphaerae bacterium]|nr:PocR ligand-binding domain-containing protein [Phycisphaerae bacterium]